MNTRIYNARIVTMEEDKPILEGTIEICGDTIQSIHTGSAPSSEIPWDREIDANGDLILPGFKDAHTHSAMTFLRSYADDMPLQDWLNKQVFPMEAKLTDEDVYWCARLAVLEYLTSGITANFDMYMHTEAVAKASVDSGFRTVLCGSINDFVSSIPETEQDYLHFNAYDPLISYQLGFHAEYTTSRSVLEQLSALCHKYHTPVYTHNSETAAEVAGCVERYGMTPTVFLDYLGLFDYGGGGFHCVHMTEEDLAVCCRRGLHVVTNPASNVKLASGIAPLQKMYSLGIPLAIGTDGPASNNCLDMFREMFLTTGLQKLATSDAAAMPADAVLAMATTGGAHAMCLSDCDTLAPGKKADLIRIDLNQPNMQPVNHLTHNLVYSGSKQNIRMTMVNGKILYEDGIFHVGEDPARIYAKANESINRMR